MFFTPALSCLLIWQKMHSHSMSHKILVTIATLAKRCNNDMARLRRAKSKGSNCLLPFRLCRADDTHQPPDGYGFFITIYQESASFSRAAKWLMGTVVTRFSLPLIDHGSHSLGGVPLDRIFMVITRCSTTSDGFSLTHQ